MPEGRSQRRSRGLPDRSKSDDSKAFRKPGDELKAAQPLRKGDASVNTDIQGSDADDRALSPTQLPSLPVTFQYKPIVILEPHLDDGDAIDPIDDDGSPEGRDPRLDALSNQIDQSGRVYVWQQSDSNRLIAADLLSVSSPVVLEPLQRGGRDVALLNVEKHGRGFGAVFKEGQRYLFGFYSSKGTLRRTKRLTSSTLEALELKYQDDFDGNSRLGPRQSRRAADQARGALLGGPIQPLEGFIVGSSLDPLGALDPLAAMAIPSVVCELPPPLI